MNEFGIVDGGQRMAEALGANVQRSPDALGADGFAGVDGQTESGVAGFAVDVAKEFGCAVALVAAYADADNAGIVRLHLGSFAEDAGSRLDSEMPDGVEDPVESDAEVFFRFFAGLFDSGEYWLEFAAAPVINE